MHVKVSGAYSLVTGVWSKISGTWTAMHTVLVKTSPVTLGGNSYPWAVNYKKYGSGSLTVTGEISFWFGYGIINSARWYTKTGTYKTKATVTLGNSGAYKWFLGSRAYTPSAVYKCAYDGQTVSYPFTGHYHYSGNTQYTVYGPEQTTTADGNGVDFYMRIDAGSNSTMTLDSLELFKVS